MEDLTFAQQLIIVIVTGLLGGGLTSLIGTWWVLRANRDNSAAQTAQNALNVAKAATDAQLAVINRLGHIEELLKGRGRIVADFDMPELVANGRAPIISGSIELIKDPTPRPKRILSEP